MPHIRKKLLREEIFNMMTFLHIYEKIGKQLVAHSRKPACVKVGDTVYTIEKILFDKYGDMTFLAGKPVSNVSTKPLPERKENK